MTAVLDTAETPAGEPPVAEGPVAAPPVGGGLTCAAAVLATAAFGWVAGSVFTGQLARSLGLLAALAGVSVVALSSRFRRPAVVQYAGAGLALVLGALVVLPSTGAGADLPALVLEALRGGGLGQPPVAFDPGWRFLLVVAVALLGQTSAGLALAYGRPRLAAATVLPFVVGAALLQPPGREVTGTLVGLLLLLASLMLALGADQAGDGAGSAGFELRRLARGALALLVLGGVLVGAAHTGFLFPPATAQQVVPPMRPPTPPPATDRVLFTVRADRPATWRLGTLDVYRSPAWLTPPYDSSTLESVDGAIPTSRTDLRGPLSGADATTVRITLGDYTGKALPGLANPLAVRGAADLLYDPRTQQLRSGGTRLPTGTTYDVTAAAPPTGLALTQAGPPPAGLREFLDAPVPPAAVTALLAEAPQNPFARLQFLRRAYFAKVVAAGSGNPVDVPAARVAEMLEGKDASPYEITAGEALLARWAGVPARIGYGWYGGQPTRDPQVLEVRPRNGATWLEAYFTGSGWVPIVGVPPRAKASLSTGQRNTDPSVRPTDELALVVYAPVRLTSVRLPYVLVRFYAVRTVPLLLLGGLLLVLYPALWKQLRRVARSRAARRLGPRAQVAAAYAELRDLATDLSIGHPALTPLEFVDRVAPDAEHHELAWLVTRALWGDLSRDLQRADVVAAQELSRSVAARLRTAQPGFARLAAASSRASLADPWTRELPILWSARRRPAALVATALVGAVAVLVSLGGSPVTTSAAAVTPTGKAVPAQIGDVRLVRELKAENAFRARQSGSLAVAGQVYSLRERDVVQGSWQTVLLAADVDTRSPQVRDTILSGFAGGRFRPTRIGGESVYRLTLAEQTLLLSFDTGGRRYSLMTARSSYAGADRLFAALLASGRGEPEGSTVQDVPLPDPRHGSAQ